VKVARVYDFYDIRIEEMPVPAIGIDEILVQTKACGICSGDVMPWYIRSKAPLVLGHEPAGVVAAVGDGVTGFRPGDRVFVHHHAPCFTCNYCRRAAYSMCATWKSSHIDPGGMAEFFRVPVVNLQDTLLLPDNLTFTGGALIEPVACVVKALRRAGIRPGDTVLVIGLGIMGQILALLARHYGAGQVLAADLDGYRCHRARQLGVDLVINNSGREDLLASVRQVTDGHLAEVVVVGPPNLAALQVGLECTAKGGTLLMFTPTPPGDILPISPHDLYFKEISIIPSYSCGPDDTREALRLLATGMVDAEGLITHRFTLDQAGEAFRAMAAGSEVIKAVVYFD